MSLALPDQVEARERRRRLAATVGLVVGLVLVGLFVGVLGAVAIVAAAWWG